MKGKRILVVDDDTIVLDSCKVVLEAEGFSVVLVSSAATAMEHLEHAGIFDMMIMDVKMPDGDGVYLLQRITEKWPLANWPEIPVLVMSGYPTPETIRTFINRGVKEFIPKPFTPDELLEAVYRLLERTEGADNMRDSRHHRGRNGSANERSQRDESTGNR
jgi:DNA-binding NtrC family response regulator